MLIKSMARARSIVVKIAKKFTSLSWRKKILSIAVVLIVLIIALGQISSLTAPPSYTSQKVEKSNITEVVTESGNISLNGKINVYSPTEGVVTEVLVKNGDYVEEGDILFKAESSATEQESQQAYSTYLSAVSTLNAAQSTADTLRAGMYTQWKSFTDIATNSTYEKGDDTPNVENRQAAEFQIAQDTWKAAEKKFKDQETAISQAKETKLKKKGKEEEEEKIIEVDDEAVVTADDEEVEDILGSSEEEEGIDEEDVNPFGDRWEE
jgi:multidrug efflux pump subunit AcrA (membrane-fusion protein)